MILNQLVIMLAVDKTLSEAMLSRTLIIEMYWMPLRESRYHDSMTFRNITGRGQMKKNTGQFGSTYWKIKNFLT